MRMENIITKKANICDCFDNCIFKLKNIGIIINNREIALLKYFALPWLKNQE
jgi:hypothetical protein